MHLVYHLSDIPQEETVLNIEDLRKKFGKRMDVVEKWLTENSRVSYYVVDSDGEISCAVRGENDEYTVFVSPQGVVSCSCMGFKSHKSICKHILFTLMLAWIKGDIHTHMFEKILGGD